MAEAPAPTELTLDQELENLKTSMETPKSPEPTPAPAPAPTEPTPPVTTEPTPPEESDLDKKLDAIETPKEVEAPKLSTEQQKILSAFATPEAAEEAQTQAQYFQQLNTAISSGDFKSVEDMFAPPALDAFKEYLYQKHVQSEEWINRWIAEKDGNTTVHKGMTAMEYKIAQLEAKIAQKDAGEQKAHTEAQRAQTHKGYTEHMNGLFDKIEFSPNDRRWVMADITGRISADPKLYAAYQSGNLATLNPVFKAAVKEYVTRDKAVAEGRKQAEDANAQHKPLIQGAALTPQGEITDEQIASAPREQRAALRERQMDEQLNNLARTKRK